jgi:hypothetical protein
MVRSEVFVLDPQSYMHRLDLGSSPIQVSIGVDNKSLRLVLVTVCGPFDPVAGNHGRLSASMQTFDVVEGLLSSRDFPKVQ